MNMSTFVDRTYETIQVNVLLATIFKERLLRDTNKVKDCLKSTEYSQIFIKDYGYFAPLKGNNNFYIFRKSPFGAAKAYHITKDNHEELYNSLTSLQDDFEFIRQFINQINSKYNINYPEDWIKSFIPKIVVNQLYPKTVVGELPSKDIILSDKDKENMNKFRSIVKINAVKSFLLT